MNFLIIIFIIFVFTFFQEVPLKPTDEFEVKLDYSFKQRPPIDRSTLHFGTPVRNYEHRSGRSMLPYLVLNIRLLHLQEEKMRLHVSTNLDRRIRLKKVSADEVIELDLGFTDDMVDRVKAHRYTLTFLDSNREPVDKIVIAVGEDGSFYVNSVKRGKF